MLWHLNEWNIHYRYGQLILVVSRFNDLDNDLWIQMLRSIVLKLFNFPINISLNFPRWGYSLFKLQNVFLKCHKIMIQFVSQVTRVISLAVLIFFSSFGNYLYMNYFGL